MSAHWPIEVVAYQVRSSIRRIDYVARFAVV